MRKLTKTGIVLAFAGAIVTLASIYVAVENASQVNINNPGSTANFVKFVNTYLGVFYFGVILLAIGLSILGIKFFFWIGTVKPSPSQEP